MSAEFMLLGPTNTGKTHRAIERMLEHRTGMMGLPLRLLAREVYDRVSEHAGESQVALVTGEEKRIPKRPRYWICTVEAMPMSTEVDFLAIDEIQLAAHPERGHVFTDRLLGARGTKETWFMGAETMRDLALELVPTATLVKSPRLSTLRGVKQTTLATLPRRSAVVAFSLPRVFELAARIKQKRGGAAVVIGALSPRARNAQVALYQANAVDFLVATDAIGMGLNLDIDHVAFADVRKFDGAVARDLDPAEMGQIAGRAGRYVRDGTFGTLAPAPELSEGLRRTIEEHRFVAVRSVWWRSADLEWGSAEDLLASLKRPSSVKRLKRMDRAIDQAVLASLTQDARVRRLARDETSVRLLWATCSIPDYRQLLFEDHAALVARIFEELASNGRLAAAPIERELDRIAAPSHDLETLMDRIASIRTWNYVAHQTGWVDEADAIRERARKIEDDLSDTLHAALVARFVDQENRRSSSSREKRPSAPRAAPPPTPSDSGLSPFAKLASMRDALPSSDGNVQELDEVRFVERAIDAPHEAFDLDPDGTITFSSDKVGRLARGRALVSPEVVVTLDVDAGSRLRLHRRLLAWSRDLVGALVGDFLDPEALSPSGRGLAHLLASRLGTVLTPDATEQLAGLTEADRAWFEQMGVELGEAAVYARAGLEPTNVRRRVALASAFHGSLSRVKGRAVWPAGHERSIPAHPAVPAPLYTAVGYPVVGRRAIRADLVRPAKSDPPNASS